jgi:hypothetical protein
MAAFSFIWRGGAWCRAAGIAGNGMRHGQRAFRATKRDINIALLITFP